MQRSAITCLLFALTIVAATWIFASPAEAGRRTAATPVRMRAAQRQAIRQMPLLMRPNRPGHFYGNTVRRLYYRR